MPSFAGGIALGMTLRSVVAQRVPVELRDRSRIGLAEELRIDLCDLARAVEMAQRLVDHEPEILVAARQRERERRVVEVAVEYRELAGRRVVVDRVEQRRALAEERVGL